MPQPALHVAIARRALRRWKQQGFDVPFSLHDPDCMNAFLHGSLAPDTGFFPGNETSLSSRVHHEHAGRFTRNLFEGARSERMMAYACGWLSHVLADAEIHPLVNDAAARLQDTAHWRASHVRHAAIESGLDGWWLARSPELARLRLRPAMDHRDAPCVSLAYYDAYRHSVSPAEIVAAHRRVTLWYNVYRHLGRWIGRQARAWTPLPLLRNLLSRRLSRDAAALGYLHSMRPARHFIARVRAGILRHDLWLDRHVATRCRDLPDYDLDTGERQDGWAPSLRMMASA